MNRFILFIKTGAKWQTLGHILCHDVYHQGDNELINMSLAHQGSAVHTLHTWAANVDAPLTNQRASTARAQPIGHQLRNTMHAATVPVLKTCSSYAGISRYKLFIWYVRDAELLLIN